MRVACPWFEPLTTITFPDRPRPARTPLGALYEGLCHAEGQPLRPSPDLLYQRCNFGYGRGICPHFPSASEADAVRFSSRGSEMIWILEREHFPLSHGLCSGGTPSPTVTRQAKVFRKHAG